MGLEMRKKKGKERLVLAVAVAEEEERWIGLVGSGRKSRKAGGEDDGSTAAGNITLLTHALVFSPH